MSKTNRTKVTFLGLLHVLVENGAGKSGDMCGHTIRLPASIRFIMCPARIFVPT